jgi:O-antigen/teichoic acid export membrane protein
MTAGPAFIKLWVGKGFESVFGALMILAVAVLIEMSLTSTGMLLAGTGRQRAQAIMMLFEGVIGIGLGIVFVLHLGLAGMALGYLISVSLMRGLVCVWYICRLFNISITRYYIDALLRPWLILFALAGIVRLTGVVAYLNTWASLIAFVSVLCVVYSICVYFVGTDAETRSLVLDRIRRMFLPLLVRTGFANAAD